MMKNINHFKLVKFSFISLGWITSIVFALTAVFGNYTNHELSKLFLNK